MITKNLPIPDSNVAWEAWAKPVTYPSPNPADYAPGGSWEQGKPSTSYTTQKPWWETEEAKKKYQLPQPDSTVKITPDHKVYWQNTDKPSGVIDPDTGQFQEYEPGAGQAFKNFLGEIWKTIPINPYYWMSPEQKRMADYKKELVEWAAEEGIENPEQFVNNLLAQPSGELSMRATTQEELSGLKQVPDRPPLHEELQYGYDITQGEQFIGDWVMPIVTFHLMGLPSAADLKFKALKASVKAAHASKPVQSMVLHEVARGLYPMAMLETGLKNTLNTVISTIKKLPASTTRKVLESYISNHAKDIRILHDRGAAGQLTKPMDKILYRLYNLHGKYVVQRAGQILASRGASAAGKVTTQAPAKQVLLLQAGVDSVTRTMDNIAKAIKSGTELTVSNLQGLVASGTPTGFVNSINVALSGQVLSGATSGLTQGIVPWGTTTLEGATREVTLVPSQYGDTVFNIQVGDESVGAVVAYPQQDSLFVNRISIKEKGTLTRSIMSQLDTQLSEMAREQGKQFLRIAARPENLGLYKRAGYIQEEGTNVVRKDVSEFQYAPSTAMAQWGDVEGIEEWLATDPVASYTVHVGNRKVHLDYFLKQGDWPESFTVKEAAALMQKPMESVQSKIKKGGLETGRVDSAYVLDEISEQFGLTEEEFIRRLESIKDAKRQLRYLETHGEEQYIPKAAEGQLEAGLQLDMEGKTTLTQPLSKGKPATASMEDYAKLQAMKGVVTSEIIDAVIYARKQLYGDIWKDIPVFKGTEAEKAQFLRDLVVERLGSDPPITLYRGFKEGGKPLLKTMGEKLVPEGVGAFWSSDINIAKTYGERVYKVEVKASELANPSLVPAVPGGSEKEFQLASALQRRAELISPAVTPTAPAVEPTGVATPQEGVPPTVPPTRPTEVAPEPSDSIDFIIRKLTAVVQEAKPARAETEFLKTVELGRRVPKMREAALSAKPEEAGFAAMGQLRGELPKAQFTAPTETLTEADVRNLYLYTRERLLRIKDDAFKWLHTDAALRGLLAGKIPTQGELVLLEDVFGPELIEAILAKRPVSEKILENVMDVMNVPRAVLASADFSAWLRQGAFIVTAYPDIGARALAVDFKTFFSGKYTREIDHFIRNTKYASLREKAGLYLAPIEGTASARLSQREEAFMSKLVHKIPIIGHNVKWSERAYVSTLNYMRAMTFDRYAAMWEGQGYPQETYRQLATLINWATGRGPIGKLANMTPVLNAVFFATRLQTSRAAMLFGGYKFTSPPVRKAYARMMLSFFGTMGTIVALGALAGLWETEKDPRSGDFGKMRIGNIRLDPWAGFQPVARLIAQLITGQRATATGRVQDISRMETLERFMRSKSSPAFGLAWDLIEGETFIGEALSLEAEGIGEQVYQRLTPLFIQDMIDSIKEEGWLGGMVTLPAILGVGAVTYPGSLDAYERHISAIPGDMLLDWQKGIQMGGEQLAYQNLNVLQKAWLRRYCEEIGDTPERKEVGRYNFYEAQSATYDEFTTLLNQEAQEVTDAYRAGEVSLTDYIEQTEYLRNKYFGQASTLWLDAMREKLDPLLHRNLQRWNEEEIKPEDEAYEEYMTLRANPPKVGGVPDWDAWDKALSDFMDKQPQAIQDYIEQRRIDWINNLPEDRQAIERLVLDCESILDDYYAINPTERYAYRDRHPEVDARLIILRGLKPRSGLEQARALLQQYGISTAYLDELTDGGIPWTGYTGKESGGIPPSTSETPSATPPWIGYSSKK